MTTDEIGEGDKVKKKKEEQRQGEFVVHGVVGAEGNDGIIGEKEGWSKENEQDFIEVLEEEDEF